MWKVRGADVMSLPLFGTSNLSCSADKPNAVLFRFAVRRHVNAAKSVCDGLGTEQNTEGG